MARIFRIIARIFTVFVSLVVFSLGVRGVDLMKSWAEEHPEIKAYCEAEKICEMYTSLRQTCATAGNYYSCMDIKLGTKKLYDSASMCTKNGDVALLIDKIPSPTECWLNSFIN